MERSNWFLKVHFTNVDAASTTENFVLLPPNLKLQIVCVLVLNVFHETARTKEMMQNRKDR